MPVIFAVTLPKESLVLEILKSSQVESEILNDLLKKKTRFGLQIRLVYIETYFLLCHSIFKNINTYIPTSFISLIFYKYSKLSRLTSFILSVSHFLCTNAKHIYKIKNICLYYIKTLLVENVLKIHWWYLLLKSQVEYDISLFYVLIVHIEKKCNTVTFWAYLVSKQHFDNVSLQSWFFHINRTSQKAPWCYVFVGYVLIHRWIFRYHRKESKKSISIFFITIRMYLEKV